MKIAIVQDPHVSAGRDESFSRVWESQARDAGFEVESIPSVQQDLIERVRDCAGFLWCFFHAPSESRQMGMRIVQAIEHGLGIPVFPNWHTIWHYDDKAAQSYLLTAARIPIPKTWVFWNYGEALEFLQCASYPLVFKLPTGAGSINVRLLSSFEEAKEWLGLLFWSGAFDLNHAPPSFTLLRKRLRPALRLWIKGRTPDPGPSFDYHKKCMLVQEFLPDNPFDTRITVIGQRAFGFRRFNRPNDFRASGSGLIDYDPGAIDEETVRLGFTVAQALKTQSVAIDGLRRGDERVVGEISYTYLGWAVHDCPGHWELDGEPATGELRWVDGPMHPAEAIFEDFSGKLLEHTTA